MSVVGALKFLWPYMLDVCCIYIIQNLSYSNTNPYLLIQFRVNWRTRQVLHFGDSNLYPNSVIRDYFIPYAQCYDAHNRDEIILNGDRFAKVEKDYITAEQQHVGHMKNSTVTGPNLCENKQKKA